MPGTIRSVLRGERPVIRSDGTFVRDYFYVEDGAAAYMHARRAAGRATRSCAGEAFNFSNEMQITVLELVERILDADGRRARARRPQRGLRTRSAHQYPERRRRRATMLGWKPLLHARRGPAAHDRLVHATSSERRMTTTRACRSCGAADLHADPLARRDAAGQLAARPTSSSASPSRRIRSTWCFCRAARSCRSPRRCRPRCCSATTSTSRRSPTRCSRTREALVDAARSRERGLGAAQPRRRGRQQRRLPACSTTSRPACRCSASSRRATSRAWREERGIPTICRVLRRDAGARARRRGRARRRRPRQQRAGARGRPQRLRRRHLRSCSTDDGVAVIEVPYVSDLIDHCEFDTIYHEHLCYFSLTALERAVRPARARGRRRRAACRSTAARCASSSDASGVRRRPPAVVDAARRGGRVGRRPTRLRTTRSRGA